MDKVTVRKPQVLGIVQKLDGKPVQIECSGNEMWVLTDKGNIYIRLVDGSWRELYIRQHKSL